MERIIALHSEQRFKSSGKVRHGYVLLTPEEAEKLENALRLARTGKLDKVRPVALAIVDEERWGAGYAAKTRLIVKGYEPRD